MKLPSKNQWRQLFKIFTKKEKIFFSVFTFLAAISSLFLAANFYYKNTMPIPAYDGQYIEGVVGFPQWLTPIYSQLNESGVDQDLVELLFSGLMKYDQNGKIVSDLIESDPEVIEEGRAFEISLRENLFWSDGQPLTADDVIFTIQTIQDPEIKSPFRASWLGVEVEKLSDKKIRFKLKNPSTIFLENLTVKIIPKHIWGNISIKDFPLSSYNLSPAGYQIVGSGPYKIENLDRDPKSNKITSLSLIGNSLYYGKKPYILKVNFRFFNNEKELISAFKNGEIKGISLTPPVSVSDFKNYANVYNFTFSRYFAVFFNSDQSKVLAEKDMTEALNYATNKKEILEKIISNQGTTVDSPILPEVYGFDQPSKIYDYNASSAEAIFEKDGYLKNESGMRVKTIKKTLAFQFKKDLRMGSQGQDVQELQKCLAKDDQIYPGGEISGYFGQKTKDAVIKFQEKYRADILDPEGLKTGNGEIKQRTRDKLNEVCFDKPEEIIPLKVTLSTVNQPTLVKTAELLKSQWQALGVEVEIKTFDIPALERDVIKTRGYEALLFGEVLGMIPDPFPYWHSSQRTDPGLNLTDYSDKKSDDLLEEARKILDTDERKKDLETFQNLLIEKAPAVFLYKPDYLYLVSKEIKGIEGGIFSDPSERLSNITDWYIKTKRAWK